MVIVLGVDIGVTGALAWVSEDRQLLRVIDMPTTQISHGKRAHQEVHPSRLIAELREFHHPSQAIIEEPVARPIFTRSKQTGERMRQSPNIMSLLLLGDSFGTVRAAIAGCGIPLRRVVPSAWKRTMGVTSDKDESRRLACEAFPAQAELFARKKDDGRAEAALLALWGLNQ